MFEIKRYYGGAYQIVRGTHRLHSDGSVYETTEFFPTEEAAQAVLDKFYPKPKHVWEHGDVFIPAKNPNSPMIYMHYVIEREDQVFSLNSVIGGPAIGTVDEYINGAKFLFNIREKL